jgi:hypothetical protein
MSIPTMSFENLRDIIANPENAYSRNKSFQSDNQEFRKYTKTATNGLNMIYGGENILTDNSYNDKIKKQNEIDKNTPYIYESDEIRRGL